MAGAHAIHSILCGNFAIFLGQALYEKGCTLMNNDFQIVTPGEKSFFYPDASVICGGVGIELGWRSPSPSLVLEVLSPSTRTFDLSEKRREYQKIPSLRYLLYLESQTVAAQLYVHAADGKGPEQPNYSRKTPRRSPFPIGT